MKWLVRFILMASCAALSPSEAAERVVETYTITNGWVDSNSIYIVYEHLRQKIHVSLADIDGTVKSKQQESFVLKLDKVNIGSSNSFALHSTKAATNLLYGDEDFQLLQHDTGVELATVHDKLNLQKCDGVLTPLSGIVRLPDGLYYCGTIYTASGQIAYQISTADKFKLSELAGSRENAAGFNRFLSSRWETVQSQNLLLFSRNGVDRSSAEFVMASLNLTSGEMTRKVARVPESSGGADLQLDSSSYSPAWFVLRPVAPRENWIVLCSSNHCRKIAIPWSYSYAIVDSTRHELIVMRQANLTSRDVQVSTIPLHDD